MAEYRLLQADTNKSLELMVLHAVNVEGMTLYGSPMEMSGRKVQAVVKGIDGGQSGELPEEIIYRVSEAEIKAAQASLKASEARMAADAAMGELSALSLGLSQKADLSSGRVPYSQLPEFPVGRKVNVANKAARLALSVYGDLTIAYESDTGDAWGLDANQDPAIDASWSPLGNTMAIGVASFNGRTGNIAPQSGDYIAAMISETPEKRFVTSSQISEWDAKPGPAEISSAISLALSGDDLPFESKQHAADTYMPKGDRDKAGGVAPLGQDKKVPAANLPPPVDTSGLIPSTAKGAASGVAPLDTGARVPIVNLPAHLPRSIRIWRDLPTNQQVPGVWKSNNSGNEMIVFLRSTENTSSSRFFRGVIRKDASDTNGLEFASDAQTGTTPRRVTITLFVPPGYQYMIGGEGGTTASTILAWREMS
jgi:hypothetical protein